LGNRSQRASNVCPSQARTWHRSRASTVNRSRAADSSTGSPIRSPGSSILRIAWPPSELSRTVFARPRTRREMIRSTLSCPQILSLGQKSLSWAKESISTHSLRERPSKSRGHPKQTSRRLRGPADLDTPWVSATFPRRSGIEEIRETPNHRPEDEWRKNIEPQLLTATALSSSVNKPGGKVRGLQGTRRHLRKVGRLLSTSK